MTVEAPESPSNIALLPPLPTGGDWLRAPEVEPFKDPNEAALWLRVAASKISGKNAVKGVWARFKEHTELYDGAPTVTEFEIGMHDDLDGVYRIAGKERTHDGNHGLSTSIDYTTKTPGIKPYTSEVIRDDPFLGYPSIPVAAGGKVTYSVSKYNYELVRGSLKQEQSRTKPGELSKKEAKEAEKRYLELSREFREALESKLARTAPEKIDAIQASFETERASLEAQKKATDAGFLGRLGLRRKLRA